MTGGLGCLLAAAGLNWFRPKLAHYELPSSADEKDVEWAEPGVATS